MEDMISRKALCEYALNQKDKSITPNDIMRFPSAQPDSKETSYTHKALDTVSRQAALDWMKNEWNGMVTSLFDGIKALPSAEPEIIRCKDCEYGEQDEYGRWYCRGFGCQVGDEDGNGFCSDAERRK